MANRILRDWTQSETINRISEKAEVFFTRLIMKADDFGCFYGNVKLLKSNLYPLKEISDSDLRSCVSELSALQLIVCYSFEGKDFIKIINFGQRLRIMKSRFPQPNDSGVLTSASIVLRETEVETETETETETEVETEKKRKALEILNLEHAKMLGMTLEQYLTREQ